jgi:hypothetical protein
VRAENAIPGRHRSGNGPNARTVMPSTIAKTGEPRSGTNGASSVAISATEPAATIPGSLRSDVRLRYLVHLRIADPVP